MKEQYLQVCQILRRVDFSRLWPGFHPYPFSLYDGVHAMLDGELVPCPPHFRGGTALYHQGRPLAIWNVAQDPPRDPELFAAALVHEMFHAFQLELGERRFPDDLALAAAPLTPETLALAAAEFSALAAGDLPRFKSLRERRRDLTGDVIREEFFAETIEGTAQYIQFSALSQLDPQKGSAALEECRKALSRPQRLTDLRRRAYDSGALLLCSTIRAGLDPTHLIGRETRPVYELLAPQIESAPVPAVSPAQLSHWRELLQARQDERSRLLDTFLSGPRAEIPGPFTVIGYDPMNLFRQGEWLYSSSYLCLSGPSGKIELTGDALLRMAPDSLNHAVSYLK